MVDIRTLRGIALDDPRAVEPVKYRPCVFVRGDSVPDSIQIHKGESVVVRLAVGVNARIETTLWLIPEQAIGFRFHRLGVFLQRIRIEGQRACRNVWRA